MEWLKYCIINSDIIKENFCKNNHSIHAQYSTVSSDSLCASENKATMANMAMSVWHAVHKHNNNTVTWSTCYVNCYSD